MRIILSMLLALSFTSVQANPIIENGSFENGLTGWTTNNPSNVQVVNNYLASDGGTSVLMNPTHGDSFAVLEAGSPVTSISSSSFMVTMGDLIGFDWFFDGNDYLPFNDFGSYDLKIMIGNVPIVAVVADILAQIATSGNFQLTGWYHEEFVAPTSGLMQISFHSVNVGDNYLSSTLGIDNVTAGVPEPNIILLLALGSLLMFWISRNSKVTSREMAY